MNKTSEITFSRQKGLSFRLPAKSALKRWLDTVISGEKKELGRLSYVFCSDDYLLELNRKFLNHNYYTDILTFDYTEGKIINGEIYISIERVKENAVAYNQTFRQELLRTIVHGALHLCGNKDKTRTEKSSMRKKEDAALKLFSGYSGN